MFLVIATVIGALAGFFLGRFFAGKSPVALTPDSGIETELRRQLDERQRQLSEAAAREVALAADKARAESERQAAMNQLAEQKSLQEKSLQQQQAAQEKALAEMKAFQEKTRVEMETVFKALSADALKQSAPEFVRLATDQFAKLQESAKGDLGKRQEAIAGLLKPLVMQLETYQQRLQQSESSQSTALGEVKKQLESLTQNSLSLAKETERFRMVLKSNQSRGRWGEETLRRVVEAAGMSPYCDFVEQAAGEDGRPDLIVRLPGERIIIVDSKVPDLEFLATLESADPDTRKAALRAHADKLKETIKGLSDRNYPTKHPNSLDYVVLFLPAESLFSSALEGDSELIVWAAKRKIMLATPASLIGLMRGISVSWDQQKQTENSRDIAEAAKELYTRVVKFTEHFESIRDGLEKANKAFNNATGSYERMIRPSGNRLLELGVPGEGKTMADVSTLDLPLRQIT